MHILSMDASPNNVQSARDFTIGFFAATLGPLPISLLSCRLLGNLLGPGEYSGEFCLALSYVIANGIGVVLAIRLWNKLDRYLLGYWSGFILWCLLVIMTLAKAAHSDG